MKKLVFLFILAAMPLVSQAQFIFSDRTTLSGVDAQAVAIGEIAGGVVVFDYDNDGWEDFYLAGGEFPDHIYHNNHDGTFTNVIPEKMVTLPQSFRIHSHGGTAFDYDNDGLTDLFVINDGRDILWKNHGDTNWEDVSEKVGLKRETELNQSNCATFGDFDGDGDDDLYVGRWVRQSIFRLDTLRNQIHYAHATWPNQLYVNNGNATFTERGKEFGVNDTGTTNIAIFFDYDRDGDLDILTGNDFGFDIVPNQVYKNMLMETGEATFVNVTKELGLGNGLFCMGIGPNDYNRDGNFDFAETNIGFMPFMQHNFTANNKDTFMNVAAQIGYPDGWFRYPPSGSTRYRGVEWTTLFNDWDNDGWEDAFVTHGFLLAVSPWYTNEHDTSMFLHNDGGTFHDVTDSQNFYIEASGRGAANVDFDNDGRMDILFGSVARSAGIATQDFKLFYNETPRDARRSWLEIKCIARRTAKEAIGTTIDVWTGGIRHTRQVSTGGGFASMTTLTQHFGLGNVGESGVADSIVIFWPANNKRHRQIDRKYHVPINKIVTYQEDTLGYWKEGVNQAAVLPLNGMPSQVFPSPAIGEITITRSDDAKCNIEIYNVLGVRVMESVSQSKETKIPITNLTPGAYTLHIIRGKEIETKMFIKQ